MVCTRDVEQRGVDRSSFLRPSYEAIGEGREDIVHMPHDGHRTLCSSLAAHLRTLVTMQTCQAGTQCEHPVGACMCRMCSIPRVRQPPASAQDSWPLISGTKRGAGALAVCCAGTTAPPAPIGAGQRSSQQAMHYQVEPLCLVAHNGSPTWAHMTCTERHCRTRAVQNKLTTAGAEECYCAFLVRWITCCAGTPLPLPLPADAPSW